MKLDGTSNRGTQGGQNFWDLRLRRDFHDWEVNEFQSLIALLHRLGIPVNNRDALWWDFGNNRVFFVKSSYEKLLIREEVIFVQCSMDSTGAEDVCLFSWLVTSGVILTTEKFEKAEDCLHHLVFHVQGRG